MEEKSSMAYSFAEQNQTTKVQLVYDVPNFAKDWKPPAANQINSMKKSFHDCAPQPLTSRPYKFVGPNKWDFTGQISVALEGDVYKVGNSLSSSTFHSPRVITTHQPTADGPVVCQRTIRVYILEDENSGFDVKQSFYGQWPCGKTSHVSLSFMPIQFHDKANQLASATLRIIVDVELSKTGSSAWQQTDVVYPAKKLQIPFLSALTRRDHADVTIECDGRSFPAHKLILSCVSSVFARMFDSSMIESATKTVKIDDIDPTTLEQMLDFIYSGSFTAPPDDSLISLLYCAEKYDLEELKTVCLLHMTSTVSYENAIKFTAAAVKCRAMEDTLEKLFDYCKRNFAVLAKNPDFKDFMRAHFDTFF